MESARYRIICVDDEPEILAILADVIRSLGHEPVTTSDPSGVGPLLEEHGHATVLVISDYLMPGMNGAELRKALLEKWRHIPFAVLSGHISREMALAAVEIKISAFLEKPFTREAIERLVAEECRDRLAALNEERELIAAFSADSEPLLEELEDLLLSLDPESLDAEKQNRIFGVIHTIKGSSGFFAPDHLHRFSHLLEDLFNETRKTGSRLTEPMIAALLAATDTLKKLSTALKEFDRSPVDVDGLVAQIRRHLDHAGDAPKTESAESAEPIEPGEPRKSQARADARASSEVRVATELLDEFLELSGEITVLRNMVKKITKSLEKQYAGNRDVPLLSDLLEQMNKINTQMQDKISDLRKVPMKVIHRPLSRTVRELSAQLGKGLELITEGDELRVDKALADALNNSLIHMIRNAADHGIESPEQRRGSGKAEHGTITLRTHQRGDSIVIELSDDGRGIDPARIAEKAVEKGLRTREELARMDAGQIQMLVFEPGFSTAAAVTDVSGRGVGMDMVKTSTEKLGGRISIDSVPGKGTRFVIHLPVPKSVLIINSMLVECCGQTFAVPQDGVVRIFSIDRDSAPGLIDELEGTIALRQDGSLIPMLDLAALLRLREPARTRADAIGRNAVVLKSRTVAFALLVDTILDIEDTVVKHLPAGVGSFQHYAGATFLGDGRVGLILDVDRLAALAGVRHAGAAVARTESARGRSLSGIDIDSSYLLFSLGCAGRFATPLREIFRLETFPLSEVQDSAGRPVVVYRDTVLPLVLTEELLGVGRSPGSRLAASEDGTITALVVESSRTPGRRLGFVVRKVEDLANPDGELVPDVAERFGLRGNTLIRDTSCAVVDFPALEERALRSFEERIAA